MNWVWVLCFCGGWWLESSFCSLRWMWLPSLRPAPGRRFSLVFHFPENVLARVVLNLWRKHWELVGTPLFAIALSHSILTTSHAWSWAICWISFHSLVWGPIFFPYSKHVSQSSHPIFFWMHLSFLRFMLFGCPAISVNQWFHGKLWFCSSLKLFLF